MRNAAISCCVDGDTCVVHIAIIKRTKEPHGFGRGMVPYDTCYATVHDDLEEKKKGRITKKNTPCPRRTIHAYV